jgi:cephalosporin hydroxylase
MLNRLRRGSSPYDDRLRMTGREWMNKVYSELMDRESHWMGVRAVKNPLDAWVYQEILHEVRPRTIVELGSQFGGGALFFAHMLDLLGGDGKVVTVDHFHGVFEADHPRITKVTADTVEGADEVAKLCEGTTLVIHDAAHQEEKVLADLRAYAPVVTPGSYLIVEDGARDLLSGMTGPRAATIRFLQETDDFEVDTSREKFLFTYNPGGFLRRH